MLLQRSQYEAFFNSMLPYEHLIPKHRILGAFSIKKFASFCEEQKKNPIMDFQIFTKNLAMIACIKHTPSFNNKNFYTEAAWVNFSNNRRDGATVFLEAVRHARRKGYEGFIYSSLSKDYACNRLANFDHSAYGIIFDGQNKTK